MSTMPLTPPPSDTKSSSPIDLHLVRKLFAAPACVVESNFLRREVAARMRERLALVKIAARGVLDAGCGEGDDLPVLRERFPEAQVVGLDAALPMLVAGRKKHLAALSSIHSFFNKWLPVRTDSGQSETGNVMCGDFAQLPLANNATDVIWSNLALHWHPQPDRVFAEWRRVLRVDGLLMFSCFGPDTFKQLRTAFAAVDDAPHALPFVDMHDFGDMLINAGFSTPVMDMEAITVTYASVDRLLADVRAWGGNPLLTRRRGLMGANAWRRVLYALEQLRQPDGKIPLSFEIIYGHAFRPAPRLTARGEAIIRIDKPNKR